MSNIVTTGFLDSSVRPVAAVTYRLEIASGGGGTTWNEATQTWDSETRNWDEMT